MSDDKLELQIGDTLQFQFVSDESQRRYYAKVIGYLQDRSVLITTPRVGGNLVLARKDQMVIVRMMTGNQVYGFTTQILTSNLTPYAYIHLAYPKEMEHITVRKAERITTTLVGSVERETAEPDDDAETVDTEDRITFSCIIQDISTSGSMIASDDHLGDIGDMISLTSKLSIGGKEEYVCIPCIIRNIIQKSDEERIRYGLEFQLLEEREHFILHGYVYEQMIMHMKQ